MYSWTNSTLQLLTTNLKLFTYRAVLSKVGANNTEETPSNYEDDDIQLFSANTTIHTQQQKLSIWHFKPYVLESPRFFF